MGAKLPLACILFQTRGSDQTHPPHYCPLRSGTVINIPPYPGVWYFLSADHTLHTTNSDQRAASKRELKELSLMLPIRSFLISQHFPSNGSHELSAAWGNICHNQAVPFLTFPFSSARTPSAEGPEPGVTGENEQELIKPGTLRRWESKATEKRSTSRSPFPRFSTPNCSFTVQTFKTTLISSTWCKE